MTATPPPAASRDGAWYRQPVLWLGAAVFFASMAGCIWLIVQGARHADEPVDAPHKVFGVPAPSREALRNEPAGRDRPAAASSAARP